MLLSSFRRSMIVSVVLLFLSIPLSAKENVLRQVVADISPWLVRIDTIGGLEKVDGEFANEGTCTGLLLDKEGFVLSSAFNFLHDPTSILLRFADGSKKVARKVATDRNRMLTLLQVEGLDPAFLSKPYSIASKEKIRVGDPCIGVGVALSGTEPNIAAGVVSGKNRIWGKAIQTDAAVGPNNYGGPLLDFDGHILGILVPMSMSANTTTAGAETYDAGVGLAVPMEDIQHLLPRLKEGKDLFPGTLGLAMKENRIFIGDAIVDGVVSGLPAAEAGLKPGDKIIAVDGKPVDGALALSMNLRPRYADEEIRLTFQRKNVDKEIVLKTVVLPNSLPEPPTTEADQE